MCSRWLAGGLLIVLSLAPVRGEVPEFLGKPLTAWAQDLSSSDARVRRSGAFALGRLGPAAVTALPQLIEALADRDAGVREAAASAVGEIGPEARDALPTLLDRLSRDPEPRVRRSAACAVGGLKAPAATGSSALEKALNDASPAVRQMAAWALGQLQPLPEATALEALPKALADTDPLVRRDVIGALGDLGRRTRGNDPNLAKARELVRQSRMAVLACFRSDRDLVVRKAALTALVNLVGPDDTQAVDDLRTAVRDPDPEIARTAALALANIGGSRAARAVSILAEVVGEGDSQTFAQATMALMNLFPGLNQAQKDSDPEVRLDAQQALSAKGALFAQALPAWIKALDPAEPDQVRLLAAGALHPLAMVAEEGLPTFLKVLQHDKNSEVRLGMVAVLRPYADREAVRAGLEAVLDESDKDTTLLRYVAAEALAERLRDKAPAKVLSVLLEFLNAPAIQLVRTQASVSSSGSETPAGSAQLEQRGIGDARAVAAQALGKIGTRANQPEIIRGLEKATQAKDEGLRTAAREALERIQKPEP